jgi:hypothetical protein
MGRLAGTDGAGLADAELVTLLDALEGLKAACAAAQARVTVRFVDTQAAAASQSRATAAECARIGDFDGWVAARDRARALELEPDDGIDVDGRGGSSGSRVRSRRRVPARSGVSAQVALARRVSPARGANLAAVSVALVRDLPHTLAALTAGVISERRAELVARGTSHLSGELRASVDAEVVGANLPAEPPTGGGVGSWGDRELERRVRASADRLDAAAAVARARTAERERRVTIRPVPDTMAIVSAVLPVAQAVAVHAALAGAAARAASDGDPRGRGQVMADTLVERVTGQASAEGVPVEVQVVITDRALLAGDDTPAHVPRVRQRPRGLGPRPAHPRPARDRRDRRDRCSSLGPSRHGLGRGARWPQRRRPQRRRRRSRQRNAGATRRPATRWRARRRAAVAAGRGVGPAVVHPSGHRCPGRDGVPPAAVRRRAAPVRRGS